MKQKELIESLVLKATTIAEELRSIELQFNLKKEEFLKVQGALEALNELDSGEEE